MKTNLYLILFAWLHLITSAQANNIDTGDVFSIKTDLIIDTTNKCWDELKYNDDLSFKFNSNEITYEPKILDFSQVDLYGSAIINIIDFLLLSSQFKCDRIDYINLKNANLRGPRQRRLDYKLVQKIFELYQHGNKPFINIMDTVAGYWALYPTIESKLKQNTNNDEASITPFIEHLVIYNQDYLANKPTETSDYHTVAIETSEAFYKNYKTLINELTTHYDQQITPFVDEDFIKKISKEDMDFMLSNMTEQAKEYGFIYQDEPKPIKEVKEVKRFFKDTN
jgi:hypothetical protein